MEVKTCLPSRLWQKLTEIMFAEWSSNIGSHVCIYPEPFEVLGRKTTKTQALAPRCSSQVRRKIHTVLKGSAIREGCR